MAWKSVRGGTQKTKGGGRAAGPGERLSGQPGAGAGARRGNRHDRRLTAIHCDGLQGFHVARRASRVADARPIRPRPL